MMSNIPVIVVQVVVPGSVALPVKTMIGGIVSTFKVLVSVHQVLLNVSVAQPE